MKNFFFDAFQTIVENFFQLDPKWSDLISIAVLSFSIFLVATLKIRLPWIDKKELEEVTFNLGERYWRLAMGLFGLLLLLLVPALVPGFTFDEGWYGWLIEVVFLTFLLTLLAAAIDRIKRNGVEPWVLKGVLQIWAPIMIFSLLLGGVTLSQFFVYCILPILVILIIAFVRGDISIGC